MAVVTPANNTNIFEMKYYISKNFDLTIDELFTEWIFHIKSVLKIYFGVTEPPWPLIIGILISDIWLETLWFFYFEFSNNKKSFFPSKKRYRIGLVLVSENLKMHVAIGKIERKEKGKRGLGLKVESPHRSPFERVISYTVYLRKYQIHRMSLLWIGTSSCLSQENLLSV